MSNFLLAARVLGAIVLLELIVLAVLAAPLWAIFSIIDMIAN